MANTGEKAYNGGLGAKPPAGSRDRAPGQGVRGRSPTEAESLLVVEHPKEAANLFLYYFRLGKPQVFLSVSPKLKEWSTRSISVTILAYCLATDSQRNKL